MLRAAIAVAVVLAAGGCAGPPGATGCGGGGALADEEGWRLQGRLDRDLTEAECAEFMEVAGRAPQFMGTDVWCEPSVDPYDCNHISASAAGFSEDGCERARTRLEPRTYWRQPPECYELPT